MPTVGGISCTFVHTGPERPKTPVTKTHVWETQGHSGYGAYTEGTGRAPWRFEAVLYDSHANVETWITAVLALVGTIITIEDDWQVTHTGMLVTDVESPRKAPRSALVRGAIILSGVDTKTA